MSGCFKEPTANVTAPCTNENIFFSILLQSDCRDPDNKGNPHRMHEQKQKEANMEVLRGCWGER